MLSVWLISLISWKTKQGKKKKRYLSYCRKKWFWCNYDGACCKKQNKQEKKKTGKYWMLLLDGFDVYNWDGVCCKNCT